MKNYGSSKFIKYIEDRTDMLDNLLAQAEIINKKIRYFSNSRQHLESYLEEQDSINTALFYTLDSLCKKELIENPNPEVLSNINHLSPRKSIFFLLSYLYSQGIFDENEELEATVYGILCTYFSHTDTGKIKFLEIQHNTYISKTNLSKKFLYHDDVEESIDMYIDGILEVLYWQEGEGEKRIIIINFFNYLHSEDIISREEVLDILGKENLDQEVEFFLRSKLPEIQDNISENNLQRIHDLITTE